MTVSRPAIIIVLIGLWAWNAEAMICSWEEGESNILSSSFISYLVVGLSAVAGSFWRR